MKKFTMTEEEYLDAENEYMGLCVECGADRFSCEPDARKYQCEICGKNSVYGTPELLIMGNIEIVDD